MTAPLQALPSAGTITEGTDIVYLQQPSKSTKDTKATLTQILAAPYAAISTETTARVNADTTLTNNLDTEATTRANADTTLTNNLTAETAARTNADATLTTEATKRRQESYRLGVMNILTGNALPPVGQLVGPSTEFDQTQTGANFDLASNADGTVDPLVGWYELTAYSAASSPSDATVMQVGSIGMKNFSSALAVATPTALDYNRRFMMYWSRSLATLTVYTDIAHGGSAVGLLGLLLPENPPAIGESDERIVRIKRINPAYTLSAFTLSVHRPAYAGNFSVALPLHTLYGTAFTTGGNVTFVVRARRAAGNYNWKVDTWLE